MIDQFGYNLFFAAPFGVLTYEWKNNGISIRPVRDLVHLATLSRQDYSNTGRDLGSLDSAYGDHLFAAARAAISAFRTRAFFLGFASHLHDQSIRGKSRSRRANRAGPAMVKAVTEPPVRLGPIDGQSPLAEKVHQRFVHTGTMFALCAT